jgi:hypothetical protein
MTKKYIIEYLGGTKGDMLCRFLNNLKPDLESTGKSKPVKSSVPSWLKIMDPNELTLERFDEALSKNLYEYMPAHALWVTNNKDYRDLLKKYNYEIYSLKFKPEHYVTIIIEALIKNMTLLQKSKTSTNSHLVSAINRNYRESGFHHLKDKSGLLSGSYKDGKWTREFISPQGTLPNTEIQIVEILNILFFEDKVVPKWMTTAMDASGIVLKDLDLWNLEHKRDIRLENILKNPPNHLYKKRAAIYRLFNEMTEHRTILNYEDLYLSEYPFPDQPDREEEWKDLVENSWCDYDSNGYRKFILPDKPIEITNKITKIVMEYLEQWKK